MGSREQAEEIVKTILLDAGCDFMAEDSVKFVAQKIAAKDAEIDRLNLAHAHATAAAARRVRELEEALAAMVRAFESGWPSHATESIGGLGHMPGESCNACRMMGPYKAAQSALAGKERTDGAE